MTEVEVVQLLVSPSHRFAGRPADGPSAGPDDEPVREVEVRAGLGLVGDRYFGRPAHRDAAVTLMSEENLPRDINASAGLPQTRRNILLRGVDVDSLVGSTIALDTGTGPVAFAVNRPARPCAWMDVTVGPGAQRALRGKGGVRCTPLSDGVLSLGPATFTVVAPGPLTTLGHPWRPAPPGGRAASAPSDSGGSARTGPRSPAPGPGRRTRR